MDIESRIKEFVARNLLFSEGPFNYSDEASFLQEGIIDSLGVMELVSFAESEFQLAVSPQEVTPDNFDSVNKFAGFVRRKKSAAQEVETALQTEKTHIPSGFT